MEFRYVAHFDGGSRGNPGPSACAFVLKDTVEGQKILGKHVLGTVTNNVAEYTGLINLLETALAHGITELHVRGDSKLVVEQVNGRWAARSTNLLHLWVRAQDIKLKFKTLLLEYVPREENQEADTLVNEALDSGSSAGASILGWIS